MFDLASAGLFAPKEVVYLMLAVAIMLGMARFLGEVARYLKQPAVLGEIIAGIILGKTILGNLAPEFYHHIFPTHGSIAIGIDAIIMISAALLLLVAGLEVDLSTVFKQGKGALVVGLLGMAVPFVLGAGLSWAAPEFMGVADAFKHNTLPFILFMGIAVSITALPVIARILSDLNFFKSELGMLIMSAAMINDIAGWIIFAIILTLMGGGAADTAGAVVDATLHGWGWQGTIIMTFGFIILMITMGRYFFHKAMPFVQAHTSWPGGVLGFVLVVTLLCAALTEWIGIHAIFGAFIAGVAMGDSTHLRQRTHETIDEFITNIFAPLFFVSIGLRVNFLDDFALTLVITILAIAMIGKVSGCYWGAKMMKLTKRESAAVGFGMSAQGAMGIILGQVALEKGLITNQLYVAIIVMALCSSIVAGPMMQKMLQRKKKNILPDFLADKNLILALQSADVQNVIKELAAKASDVIGVDQQTIFQAVWKREQLMRTGIGNGLAVPHARLQQIDKSYVFIGRSSRGVDFDSPDGHKAKIICLLLTPGHSQTAQLELLDLVARTFCNEETRRRAMEADTGVELIAALKIGHIA